AAAPQAVLDIDEVYEGEHGHRQPPGRREIAGFGRAASPAGDKTDRHGGEIGEDEKAEQIGPMVDVAATHEGERDASKPDAQAKRERGVPPSFGHAASVERGHRAGGSERNGKAGEEGANLR